MIQENIKDRYELAKLTGIDNGYGIGQDNRSRFELGRFESYLADCQEIEMDHFRQFSPFEFTANEFNRPVEFYGYSGYNADGSPIVDYNIIVKEENRPWVNDKIWDKYESGVTEGIERAWKEHSLISALGAPA